jgi:hypothetical protein
VRRRISTLTLANSAHPQPLLDDVARVQRDDALGAELDRPG